MFPSGDIVVRSETLFSEKELTFEKDDIEDVTIYTTTTLKSQIKASCGGARVAGDSIFIHFRVRSLEGELRNHYVDCESLTDNAGVIVDYIEKLRGVREESSPARAIPLL